MKKLIAASLLLGSTSLVADTMVVPGDLDAAGSVTWTKAGAPYILNGTIFVKGGTELTIEPGVVIRGQGRSAPGLAGPPGSLVVTATGTVIADGDPADPIIMTTAVLDADGDGSPDGAPGAYVQAAGTGGEPFLDIDPLGAPLEPFNTTGPIATSNDALWGGLVILGRAPTSVGTSGDPATSNPLAQVNHIEGLPKSFDTEYGGQVYNDFSGIFRYVSVRHGGDEIGDANEVNGITMGGVGANTVIEFCEVYCNFDDGFEWFGGTVNGNHLVVTYAGDDQFDGDEGYVGTNQFLFAVLPYFTIGSKDGDNGFEFDGDNGDAAGTEHNVNASGALAPLADYSIYNATIIGNVEVPGKTVADNGTLDLKSRWGGQIVAGYFINQESPGLTVSLPFNSNGGAMIESTFASPASGFVGATTTALGSMTLSDGNVVNAGTTVPTDNTIIADDITWTPGGLGLDPRPGFAFGGIVNGAEVQQKGVAQFDSRGAFGSTDPVLWTTDWTVLNLAGILVD